MVWLLAVSAAGACLATAGHTRPQAVVPQHVAAAVPAAASADFFSTGWLDAHPSPGLGVTARAAVLVDLDRRQVLWARAGRTQRAPASLAKMVTAMVAVDHANLDSTVRVPEAAVAVEPNVMGLSAGEVVSVRELLYGLFLDSGNDAAETLAQGLVPRDRFIAEMNSKVTAWGLHDTHFSNPSGLDAPGMRSTAYDLAVIAAHLQMDYPDLAAIAGARERAIPATGQHKAFGPRNLNKLLWQYPGATGLKTGFTDQAGGCVAATANRGGRHLAAVVLGSDIFFTDAGRLLDYGFSIPA